MTTVGFIGLGVMGTPMAANLVKAGFDVVGFDRNPPKVARLLEHGARSAATVRELSRLCDVVITMLPDSPDVEAVAFGDDGVLANCRPGALFIDMSTVRPETAVRIAEAAQVHNVRTLDAPVSGGEQGAMDGTLSVMVGGEHADFEAALRVFAAVGKTIEHVGPAGAGQTTKAANQLLVAGIIELVSEAIVLLRACNVDMQPALRVLAGGLAGNAILERKARSMLDHSFTPGFRVDLHHKDLGIMLAAARDAGVALPVAGLVAQLVAACRARGDGGADHGALLTVVEALSGTRV